jgi:hypothetical protein
MFKGGEFNIKETWLPPKPDKASAPKSGKDSQKKLVTPPVQRANSRVDNSPPITGKFGSLFA